MKFNKRTNKEIMYFLLVGVFGISVIIWAFGGNMSQTEVKPLRTQANASDEVLGEEIDLDICGLDSVDCDIETQIREIAERENFKWPDYLVRLAHCESTLDPNAVGDGGYYSRGLYQISFYYHSDIADECAFDIECSTLWTINQINAGNQNLWSCDRII